MDFYICEHCGNIVAYVEHKGVNIVCCGEEMRRIEPGSVDASREKHVPVVETEGNLVSVTVGSAPHPMTEGHHIAWIALQSEQGKQRKQLDPTAEPKAVFALTEEERVISVYAYCNLHGLWKA